MKKSTVWTKGNGGNAFFLFHCLTPILKVGFQFGTSRVPCGPCLHAGHRTVGGLGPFGWVPWPDVDGWLNIWCWHAADADLHGCAWTCWFPSFCAQIYFSVIHHWSVYSNLPYAFSTVPVFLLLVVAPILPSLPPSFFSCGIMTTTQGKVKNTKRRKRRPRNSCTPLSANRSLIWKMLNWNWKWLADVGRFLIGSFIGCFLCKNWLWIRTGWCLSLLELPWLTGASCGSQLALTDRTSEISWNSRIFVVKCSNARGLRVQAPEMLPGHKTPLEGRPFAHFGIIGGDLPLPWRFHTSKAAFVAKVSICVATVPLLVASSASTASTLALKKRWPRHWCSRCGHEWTHLCQQYPECPRALGCSCHLLRNVMRDCQTMARMWYLQVV